MRRVKTREVKEKIVMYYNDIGQRAVTRKKNVSVVIQNKDFT